MTRTFVRMIGVALALLSGPSLAAQGGPVTFTATVSVTILPAAVANPQSVARRTDVTRRVTATAILIDFQ